MAEKISREEFLQMVARHERLRSLERVRDLAKAQSHGALLFLGSGEMGPLSRAQLDPVFDAIITACIDQIDIATSALRAAGVEMPEDSSP